MDLDKVQPAFLSVNTLIKLPVTMERATILNLPLSLVTLTIPAVKLTTNSPNKLTDRIGRVTFKMYSDT